MYVNCNLALLITTDIGACDRELKKNTPYYSVVSNKIRKGKKMSYNIEDVFTTSGVPTVTYVQPKEFLQLKVAIRTRARCVVVEGPSGIGKTTAIHKVMDSLNLQNAHLLSARKKGDVELIKQVSSGDFQGIIIIDDFHRLDQSIKEDISNVMKALADDTDEDRKIIVIGINRVGDSLVHFSPDLNNRISTIRFEVNSNEKVEELIHAGENALNIKFDEIGDIVNNSRGSFHIAQLICQKICIQNEIDKSCENLTNVHVSYPTVLSELFEEFSRNYFDIARKFATGPRLHKEGRAPYLHILKWLSENKTWSLNLTTAMQQHPTQKAGVGQVVEKGFLEAFLNKHPEIQEYVHYDSAARILSVEDPKFIFYLKNINWNNFAMDIGYAGLVDTPRYDYALSFAGTERSIAESIFEKLQNNEIAVFYDKNEQADILSQNIEEYLYPIYRTDALYVVPLLSNNYPNRIWTKFESKAFKERFGKNSVVPIWFSDVNESAFDESKDYGGIIFDVTNDEDKEIDKIVELLTTKILNHRQKQGGSRAQLQKY